MAAMADCVGFQAQIAAIIEMLANSAVVEICKLVDDGYAALRSQMERERERSRGEKQLLRQKIREMDVKLRSSERRTRRRGQRDEAHAARLGPAGATDRQLSSGDRLLQEPPPSAPAAEDEPFPLPPQEDPKAPVVKQEQAERADCNLDLKVEVNIRADCALSSALDTGGEVNPGEGSLESNTSQMSPLPGDDTVDLTCRPRAKLKPAAPVIGGACAAGGGALVGGSAAEAEMKIQTGVGEERRPTLPSPVPDEQSPERLSGLGLDLAWMQERVSHLGAAFAVAQLGLGNAEPLPAPASFPAQGGAGDAHPDAPPAMLFPGAAHDMAAFAASFDLSAPVAPSAPAPPSAGSPDQNGPYRGGRAAAPKEPMLCGLCGRVFPSPAALELHQRVHTGERPYSCPHCGKGFAQPNNLRVHLLIHSGERRYRCSLCGKSFISSSHLKRHRTVHTQEKPYSCSRCGQSFSQMCSVRRHRQQSQCGL